MKSAAVDRSLHAYRHWLIAAGLAVVAFVAFARALEYGFVNFDDPTYVTQTPQVTQGLSLSSMTWAFTTFRTANWHPLTWLSLQLDATFSGSGASGFRRTNLLLHAANAALLFLVLRSFTGATWRSAAAALLFAVHPLRVESVVWISERKDVLSVCFGLLALWVYGYYVRQPSVRRYLVVVALFVLSLLSKPTLVTLPCLLLVLDWWPLARSDSWRRLIIEKLPLAGIVILMSFATLKAQEARGATKTLEEYPLEVRVENAAIGYVAYLSKTVWPSDLCIYYPHPSSPGGPGLSHAQATGSALLLAGLTAGAVFLRRRAPYLLMGWLWYLGTLVPTIGLVQVGAQAYADRYSYFPQIGILIALCWGVADLSRGFFRTAVATAIVAALALAVVTWNQLPVWKESVALWSHARQISGASTVILINLGGALDERGEADKAEDCYREAIRIDPSAVMAHAGLGIIFNRKQQLDEAAREFEEACRLAPNFALMRTSLGGVYFSQRKLNEAAREHEAALELDPDFVQAYTNLGLVELTRHNFVRATEMYRHAVARSPGSPDAQLGLGVALKEQGLLNEGLQHLKLAVRLDPQSAPGNYNLGRALEAAGDFAGASGCFERAARLNPGMAPTLAMACYRLGTVRHNQGYEEEANRYLNLAFRLDPRLRNSVGQPGAPNHRAP